MKDFAHFLKILRVLEAATGSANRPRSGKILVMCGRYRLSRPKELVEFFDAILEGDEGDGEGVALKNAFRERYNIAPTQPVAAVRASANGEGAARRVLTSLRWGLVPSWAKELAIGNRLINGRSETVLEKPAFRDSFRQRRCLIPADGFYEWKRSGKSKRPFNFGMKDGDLFAFAGIWDRWRSPEGQIVKSCAILTTTPNELVADIHDRMPVILPKASYEMWLTTPPEHADGLAELLTPFDAALMRRYEVSSLVNRPDNDSPECAKETAPTVGQNLELWG